MLIEHLGEEALVWNRVIGWDTWCPTSLWSFICHTAIVWFVFEGPTGSGGPPPRYRYPPFLFFIQSYFLKPQAG